MTKIKDVNIYKATSQISQPIADATHSISDISFCVVCPRQGNSWGFRFRKEFLNEVK